MRLALLSLWLFVALAGAAKADDAILVLDASGSMWGQIDGKSKAEIARGVVGDLLTSIPADRRLGLTAYGHRREGDCADIEEIVPVGTDREAIRKAVGALGFKGKTPLTTAVRFAADRLKYKEQRATVILVSDGAETCNADPCALGAELEAQGIDFTAHVVGFGLASETESAGLKCLAEATGGRYFSAQGAEELSQALAQTVAAPAPPAPKNARVVLRATDLAGGPEIASGLDWTVAPVGGGAAVLAKSNAGLVEAELPPGAYEVSVARAADGLKGTGALNAVAGAERTVTIPLETKLSASLVPTPSAEAPAGSKVAVKWTGPNRSGDYITVVRKGALVTEYLDYQYTERGDAPTITLPAEPGDYELRYVLGAPQRVLAAVPIKAIDVLASLGVPESAVAGSTIDVAVTGPAYPGDWITIVKPDAPVSAYNDYFNAETHENKLKTPLAPGVYEVRYVLDGKRILARAPIALTAASATLSVPASAPAGSTIEVAWTGPGDSGDWITVVKPTDAVTAYNDYFDAKPDRRTLRLPNEGGDYEVRYVQGGQKIIARAPIKVLAVTAQITAPASVAQGAEFEIGWTGPNYRGDWLTIVKPDRPPHEYGSYVDADKGTPGKLTAPTAAGTYELRYLLGGKMIIARRPIEVTAP